MNNGIKYLSPKHEAVCKAREQKAKRQARKEYRDQVAALNARLNSSITLPVRPMITSTNQKFAI